MSYQIMISIGFCLPFMQVFEFDFSVLDLEKLQTGPSILY